MPWSKRLFMITFLEIGQSAEANRLIPLFWETEAKRLLRLCESLPYTILLVF